ncbi:MAG: B12-binding domain-containing radical SAM protein [Pontiellaceae bacterium]|nr:B12-binding domain-containing radical SAM protein [Pontiellaceae bacterium]
MKSRILFIMPSVGRKKDQPYVRSWKMEPLPIAALSALTPKERFDRVFADDRIEPIPYNLEVDAVAITTETYTARRAYQIASRFRARGIPVILGGFHATLMPDEAAAHADTVLVGEAENIWHELLEDLESNTLKPRYHNSKPTELGGVFPDRSIYAGKKYIDLAMLETSRGCRYSCEFCSISAFFQRQWNRRPIEDVISEIKHAGKRNWFFVDDNIGADLERLEKLLRALVPLKIRWVGQMSIESTNHPELLKLMRRSGCAGVLIGFESINEANLEQMGKGINRTVTDYETAIARLRRNGLSVYGTFVFGYDEDVRATFEETFTFARRNRLFFAAFNHLVPFPGTPLYQRLEAEGRLLYDRWWLSPDYRFGDIAFRPKKLSPEELSALCMEYRTKFYSPSSILYRGMDLRANCRNLFMTTLFYAQNIGSLRDIHLRQQLPLGFAE